MNRYKSHKEVEAFQIVKIIPLPSLKRTDLVGTGIGVTVSQAYIDKHKPAVGGYYVRYADGYESWSPAEAFVAGYTKIEDK